MPGRWTRRCQSCGWVEQARTWSSKELAEQKAYAGFAGEVTSQVPRCSECGSHDIVGVRADDAPEASEPMGGHGG